MKTTKITLIALGALVLARGVSFATVAASGRESVSRKREHTGDIRLSTDVSSVFISPSEMRERPYVHMDTERNVLSGTNAHEIAESIKSLSPEDLKNVKVSMEISPATSPEDRAVFEKYGTFSDGNTIEISGEAFGEFVREKAFLNSGSFIEVRGGVKTSDLRWMGIQKDSHAWMMGGVAIVRDKSREVLFDTKRKKPLASYEFKSGNMTIVDKKLAVGVLNNLHPEEKVDVTVKPPADSDDAKKLKALGFVATDAGNLYASKITAKEASLVLLNRLTAFVNLILKQDILGSSFNILGDTVEISSSENAPKS